ncbi:TonB-linked SusC/RagA family outer membrane protein [Pontibacter mucosus]|uniref:TonB-linked SusC/RagA family outer membrane protein n=1 Tax=Pontibacter mucosus TaxID=1649266 RepID=A0A2T5YHW4_9BACT|nr:TonB-linked SusC/RagA family outer membrane protein [Pontibacter mucosus]
MKKSLHVICKLSKFALVGSVLQVAFLTYAYADSSRPREVLKSVEGSSTESQLNLSSPIGLALQAEEPSGGNRMKGNLFNLTGQQAPVSGRVTDQAGVPLPGVTVIVKGTTTGTTTDLEGRYTLTVPENSTLVFSFIGYLSKEVVVGNQGRIDITLAENVSALDEVVVVGYGTVKKRDLTGSVASIKGEELTAFPVPDPIMALQGRASGVQISQNTGAPDGDYTIRIRGVNSILGNNSPLFIVDGIPFDSYALNSYDIESIEILKDASATAIYGSRGANGVILVTTKRGREGQANISYNFDYGLQSPIKKLELMDAQEWARFYNEYLVNAKILEEAPFSETEIAGMGKGTDWQDLMLQDAPISNHNLTFSGGSERMRYFVSASALLRDGMIENSSFDKYNVRSTLDFSPNRLVDVSLQMGYSSIDRMNQSNGGGHGGSSMFSALYSASPLFTPYDDNGDYKDLRSWFSWSSHEIRNPVMIANETSYRTVTNLSNVNASVSLKPLEGLSIKSTLGLQASDGRYDGYTTSRYIYQNNSASVNHQRAMSIVNENIANYKLAIGNTHNFDILGGFTYQQAVNKSIAASGNTFLSDVPLTNALGSAGTVNTPNTGYSKWALMSYLGRLNYSYKGKYLATASIRADGSSRYSPGQRWGYFPSGALAWNVSEEPFLKDAAALSELKLRTSFGQTGSTAIDPYSTQVLLRSGKTATGNGNYTYYAPGTTYPEPLKWETTTQWDIGFDLGFFNQRLEITADYYQKNTTDLLNTVFLPTSSGFTSTTRNIGRMNNRGVELTVAGRLVEKQDLQVKSSLNISRNKNEVVELANGDDILGATHTSFGAGSITIIREGEPLGAFYLYKDAGLDETGQLSYEDLNGDGKYTDVDDRYIAGSPYPDFTYGFNTDVTYKNWAVNVFLQGSYGNDVFNLSEMRNYSYSQGMNVERKVYHESWREGQDNSNANYPRIERVGPQKYSDRYLEDGSYLRLKNISLAYFIPIQNSLSWVKGLNVFVSAQNYLTLTKYTGVDPEVSSKGGDVNSGIDHFTYPNTKMVTFGAKVQF